MSNALFCWCFTKTKISTHRWAKSRKQKHSTTQIIIKCKQRDAFQLLLPFIIIVLYLWVKPKNNAINVWCFALKRICSMLAAAAAVVICFFFRFRFAVCFPSVNFFLSSFVLQFCLSFILRILFTFSLQILLRNKTFESEAHSWIHVTFSSDSITELSTTMAWSVHSKWF